jgi:hypothetical protein
VARTLCSLAVTQSTARHLVSVEHDFFKQVTVLGFSYLNAKWRSQSLLALHQPPPQLFQVNILGQKMTKIF